MTAASDETRVCLHWFRRDLRLADNTALAAACREFDVVVPVFVFDPHLLEADDIGAPRVAYLLDCLDRLRRSLAEHGVSLVIRHGDPAECLVGLAKEVGATAVLANRDYGPYGRRRDRRVDGALRSEGIAWRDFPDLLLVEPWECVKDDGSPYTVFTPFSRRWRLVEKCPVARRPPFPSKSLPPRRRPAAGELPTLDALGLRLTAELPTGGEAAAARRLEKFAADGLGRYQSERNRMAVDGTSHLSADLKFGSVSPRQVFHAAARFVGPEHVSLDPAQPGTSLGKDERLRLREAGTFVSELCWRDFYFSVLFHHPRVLRGPFLARFEDFDWPEKRPEIIETWTEGRTGFPIVDAGMRQLAQTGWMHNRARMITASFLTKILLVDWRVGERVFMQRLVDGDPAANNGGWQWSASTGTDAAPYFRIFNPTLQSKKFDPDGDYIRRWVPELSSVASPLIHEPARDPQTLSRTGYPPPCVDYAAQRARALELLAG